MQNYKYYILLTNNINCYIISLLFCIIPMLYIGKKYTHSWFDPLRYAILFVPLANSVPLFLVIIGAIKWYLFLYFLCSETLFWLGFISMGGKRQLLTKRNVIEERGSSKMLFFFSIILYLTFTILSYIRFGIPIYAKSRIGTFIGSGGYGIIPRIIPFFELYILMYSYKKLDYFSPKKKKRFDYLPFMLVAIITILSGSRSAFLVFFYAYYGYHEFYKGERTNNKLAAKYMPIIIIGAVVVLYITNNCNLKASMIAFLARLASTGDCYYMSYPNEIINSLVINDNMKYLFSNILVPLRIIPNQSIPDPLGVQLTTLLYPELHGLFVGPNSRLPIYSYVLFGWNGLYFSLIIGFFTGFLLLRLPSYFSNGFISSVFVSYIYISSVAFITDISNGIANIFNIIITTIILLIIKLVLPFDIRIRKK